MRVIVPLSGGIDSALVLALAVREGHEVHAVVFDDGDMTHPEVRAARKILAHYPGVVYRDLRIMSPDHQRVQYPITPASPSQCEAMRDIDYWSGYKAVFYAAVLSYGGAIAAHEVRWGVYEWNDHFADEVPVNATLFENTWRMLYPDLCIPHFTFPLLGTRKSNNLHRAVALGVPLEHTYSCFRADGPCGQCLGCVHRRDEFAAAGLTDPTNP